MEQHKLNPALKTDSFSFLECSWESVKHLFLAYHYLKTLPAGIMAVYGLFDERELGKAVGGAVFCNGRIQYDGRLLEFSRMWISDHYGTNTESWFMAKCLKALNKKFPTHEGVVTWADCNIGHNGTIYLAANFVYDGESRTVKKFLGKNKKVIYERTSTSSDICIGKEMPKKRFIYYFDSKIREQKKQQPKTQKP
jgi:hypothetical protein